MIDLSNLFEEYQPENGENVWAVQITPDNYRQVAKRVNGRLIENPAGILVGNLNNPRQFVVDLWDWLVCTKSGEVNFACWFDAPFREEFTKVGMMPKNEWADQWWKIDKNSTQAEHLAAKLADSGFEYEHAKQWVLQVQVEAVNRDRERIKELLDTQYVKTSD